jgi:hypothetical protein
MKKRNNIYKTKILKIQIRKNNKKQQKSKKQED